MVMRYRTPRQLPDYSKESVLVEAFIRAGLSAEEAKRLAAAASKSPIFVKEQLS
jgi:hypothetical protein